MIYSILTYLPVIIGGLVALYWGIKISVHGTFAFIPTYGLRMTWICLGIAMLWFIALNYPLIHRFSSEPSLVKTWIMIFTGLVFLIYGAFASRRGLILFTTDARNPLLEKTNESDFDTDILDKEPDRSKELPY